MWIIIAVIWTHFCADFLLQSDKMAMSKSTSPKWLTIHVLVYAAPFMVIAGWRYAVVNFLLHWVTDFISSKGTTVLWKKNERHWFFVVIGLDQAVHMTCLILTLPLVTGWA